MKSLKKTAFVAILSGCFTFVSAQETSAPFNEPNYNKPALFADLPSKLSVRLAELEQLLNLPEGREISATIANGFQLTGKIVSKSNPADANLKSVVIKSFNRQGATFTFSRIANGDGTFSYAGRILSHNNGDVLEISKEGNQYVFQKKGYYDLVNE